MIFFIIIYVPLDAQLFFTSFRFYTECFGMKVLRKRDVPEEKYSNAFLGFGPEENHFVVELTYSTLLNFLLICNDL